MVRLGGLGQKEGRGPEYNAPQCRGMDELPCRERLGEKHEVGPMAPGLERPCIVLFRRPMSALGQGPSPTDENPWEKPQRLPTDVIVSTFP